MLLAGFLACTMLATSAALTACGDTSDSSSSTPESSTPEAWELDDAAVSYVVDKNGVETAVYTVKGKNGEEYTKSVATGRTVVDVDMYSVKVNGEEMEETLIETTIGNEPKIEILAWFNDGSAGWVTVTDDMYVGAKPDYTKAGLYSAQIKLVKRLSAAVFVAGDEPVVVETMFLNQDMGGMCVLWDKADVVAGTYDVSTVLWGYYTYDGENENQVVVNAKPEQIKPIDWKAESEEGVYNFSVTDENGNSGVLQAYVMDADSETTVTVVQRSLGSFTMMESLTAVKGSQVSAIDTSNMIAMEVLMVGTDAMAMRVVDVPEAAVYALDTTECGEKELTATWTESTETVTAKTNVLVYENKEEFAEVSSAWVNSYKVVESGVLDMSLEVYSYTEYTSGTGADKQVLMGTGYNTETVALTADMIKGTAPDFTTAGVKVFTVEIGGNEYTYAVELWAEEEKSAVTTTNIADITFESMEDEKVSFNGNEMYIVKDSVNFEVFVRTNFVGKSYTVSYIEAVNDSYTDYVTLKASAFDWSAVKMNTVGEYALKVSYEGYEKTITVNVVEELPTAAVLTPVAQLEIGMDFALMGMSNGLVGIILYEDNVAEIMDGFSPYYYESVWATYTLDTTSGKLELSIDGEKFAIATVVDMDTDGVYDMVNAYTFEGTATEVVLEMATPYGGTMLVTVSMYDNGYAFIMGDWAPQSSGNAYVLKDGILTIGDAKWAVVGTGADTQYLAIMSGEY